MGIAIIKGDCFRSNTECLVVEANGVGLVGRVAGLLEKVGPDVQQEAKFLYRSRATRTAAAKPFDVGTCFATGAGSLSKRGCRRIYHAVITQYPGGQSSIHSINQCLRSALDQAIRDGMRSISIPALGISGGRLDRISVASRTLQVAKDYCDKLKIVLIDRDEEFINELEALYEV